MTKTHTGDQDSMPHRAEAVSVDCERQEAGLELELPLNFEASKTFNQEADTTKVPDEDCEIRNEKF